MSSNLKKTTIKLSALLSVLLFSLSITNCVIMDPVESELIDPRKDLFQKGISHMVNEKYDLAQPIFLKLTAEPELKSDLIYDLSLWNISLTYEKLGLPEKAILALNLLMDRNTPHVLPFKLKAALMKNYYRVGNNLVAQRFKKMLDDEKPKATLSTETLFLALRQTLNLNYDHLILEELNYVGEAQKYVLYVMEQNTSELNETATDLLISIYQQSYALTTTDKLQDSFKEKILISLLDKLRLFNSYKLNDLNINLKTVTKFSNFSEKMEKQITDRLHR